MAETAKSKTTILKMFLVNKIVLQIVYQLDGKFGCSHLALQNEPMVFLLGISAKSYQIIFKDSSLWWVICKVGSQGDVVSL